MNTFNFDDFMYGVRRGGAFNGETLADNLPDAAIPIIEAAFATARAELEASVSSLTERAEAAEQLNAEMNQNFETDHAKMRSAQNEWKKERAALEAKLAKAQVQ